MAKIQVKYVQFEPSAFLSDADYQIMTAEQRGIYCSIIFYLYANGGKMPVNGEQTLFSGNTNRIALLSNCTKIGEEWEQVWNIIEKKFKIKDGVLTHKRVTAELRKADNYRKQKSLAGKKGMESRYNGSNNGDPNSDITKVSKVKKREVKVSKTINYPAEIDNPKFIKAWQDWIQHRIEIKHKLTPTTTQRQLKMLAEHPIRAVAIIENSIQNGWQGLFPDKDNNNGNSNARQSPARDHIR